MSFRQLKFHLEIWISPPFKGKVSKYGKAIINILIKLNFCLYLYCKSTFIFDFYALKFWLTVMSLKEFCWARLFVNFIEVNAV